MSLQEPNFMLTMREYARSAQKIVDSYPPEVLEKVFGNAELRLYTQNVGGVQYLDSTGYFWTRIADGSLIDNALYMEEKIKQRYPTLREWETALAIAIKQAIISKSLR